MAPSRIVSLILTALDPMSQMRELIRPEPRDRPGMNGPACNPRFPLQSSPTRGRSCAAGTGQSGKSQRGRHPHDP